MTKPLNELYDLLDELRELIRKADMASSTEERKRFKQDITNHATDLMSTSGEFSPTLTSGNRELMEEELAEGTRIKIEAEALFIWAVNNL